MRRPETGGLLPRIGGPDDFAAAFGVSRETLERFVIYAELLEKWQKTINLVAPSTLGDVWHRHMADSAQLLALAPAGSAVAGAPKWVDLGSGAGFPGLVIAIFLAGQAGQAGMVQGGLQGADADGVGPIVSVGHGWPGQATAGHGPSDMVEAGQGVSKLRPSMHLIESDARKCAFLAEVVRKTGISTALAVEIVTGRIENSAIQDRLGTPDVISARALASLGKLIGLSHGLFGPQTLGLFAKGREVEAEVAEARRTWRFDCELVPSRTEQSGRIVVVRGLEAKSA